LSCFFSSLIFNLIKYVEKGYFISPLPIDFGKSYICPVFSSLIFNLIKYVETGYLISPLPIDFGKSI